MLSSFSALTLPRRRVEAAQALERATAAGDAGRLDEARATLEAAARRVGGSAAGQEDYGRALLADLQVCRLGGRSRSVALTCSVTAWVIGVCWV